MKNIKFKLIFLILGLAFLITDYCRADDFQNCSDQIEWNDLYGEGPVAKENLMGRAYLDVKDVQVSFKEGQLRFFVKTVDDLN